MNTQTVKPVAPPGDYRSFLQQELIRRQKNNPRYSIRCFANSLGLSKTALASVLAEKRHLSRKNAAKVASALAFPPDQRRSMLAEIFELEITERSPTVVLEEDVFQVIADWYHYAILSLAKLRHCRSDPRWVAAKIGITSLEARVAIARLIRMGFLEERGGKLCRLVSPIATRTEIPSGAIQKYHRQNLKLAECSLDRDPVGLREFQSMTMAIDPKRLPEAKRMVARFARELSEYLEGGERSQVYQFAAQLFPLVRGAQR